MNDRKDIKVAPWEEPRTEPQEEAPQVEVPQEQEEPQQADQASSVAYTHAM